MMKVIKKRVVRTKLDIHVFIGYNTSPNINRRSTKVIFPLSTIFLWDYFTAQTFKIFFVKHFIAKIIENKTVHFNEQEIVNY